MKEKTAFPALVQEHGGVSLSSVKEGLLPPADFIQHELKSGRRRQARDSDKTDAENHDSNKSRLESSNPNLGSALSYFFTVDAFEDGLAIGQHSAPSAEVLFQEFGLRLEGERQVVKLRSRYMVDTSPTHQELEKHLIRLSNQGVLRKSVFILGVNNDPFHPFDGRFDASMRFLSLFERYLPGVLCIQTRSPLIVLALPVLKKLGQHCLVNFAVETSSEEAVRRYCPALPRLEERFKAIRALNRFQIPLRIQVTPVLPYGDWRRDAMRFAELLSEHASGIDLRPLSDGSEQREKRLRGSSVVQKLIHDRKFHWLRPDAVQPLKDAILKINPKLLQIPDWRHLNDKQLNIFAA
ncbi:MAG: hypothetical protein KDD60_05635 [Bdellovibrionales bacterium]|nr:hypothetical protein [Bdellovibrionales bacterium]